MYKKILIKSEEDLPKEAGWYFVHWKHPDERLHTQMGHQYYDESIKGLWFGKDWFDWYLIESPINVPTEVEAETEGDRLGERGDSNGGKFINSDYTEGFEDCYKWMRDEIIKRNK